jgi:hypothetical protein
MNPSPRRSDGITPYSRVPCVRPFLCAVMLVLPAFARAQPGSELRGSRLAPAFGVHYGAPMRFSVSAGGALDLDDRGTEGVLAVVEQGQHGGAISAGYYHMVGRFGSGFSLRAAVLRTSGEPWSADPHTTYVGAEAHLMLILGVGGRAGYMRRARSTPTGTRDGIVTLGVSIGS